MELWVSGNTGCGCCRYDKLADWQYHFCHWRYVSQVCGAGDTKRVNKAASRAVLASGALFTILPLTLSGLVSAWACMILHNLLLFVMFTVYNATGKWSPLYQKETVNG